MRVLTIDIENTPNLGYVWGLFKQNLSLAQLKESASVISFAAKWHGSSKILFYSDYHNGHETMIKAAHELISEADVLVHYNGTSFDLPHLNREFITLGFDPPAPYQQVDLLREVKKRFRFPSNKLDYVCQALDLGAKESHAGFQLWLDCIAGDSKAWSLMRKYNKQDVVITEKLYERLMPWITTPSLALYTGNEESCPSCGSENLQPRGFAYTSASTFQRYRCGKCGKWTRGTERVGTSRRRSL